MWHLNETSGTHEDSTSNANDGSPQGGVTQNATGQIDEVRISATARSGNWIKTEYNNQNSPGTFYSVGAQEAVPEGTAPVPDPSAMVLFAAGLVTLTVFFGWARRRKRC